MLYFKFPYVILECPLYANTRRILPVYYRRNLSMYKFINLCTTDNCKMLLKLTQLAYAVFQISLLNLFDVVVMAEECMRSLCTCTYAGGNKEGAG